ncbi:hypothetical protein R80B4_00894 [Fibrobacteres bacterium R8-0-B4]
MNMRTLVKMAALTALIASMPAWAVKFVAVVETEVDEASGASAEMTAAEVRLMTAGLRREAVKNLPKDRFNIMTAETVIAQGGAVLESCIDENCVIALGTKIGADYIVRGIISKLRARFALSVEMYETENGNLVASSDLVSSENIGELVEKGAAACGEMYRKFAGEQESTPKSEAEPEAATEATPKAVARMSDSVTIKDRKRGVGYYVAPKYQFPVGTPVSWGGVNIEYGLIWGNGMFLGFDVSNGMDVEAAADSMGTHILVGIGISLGGVYDLGNQLQLVYGGSLGIWGAASQYNKHHDMSKVHFDEAFNYLAPFVKLRWNYVELTYRGLLGYKDVGTDNYRGVHERDVTITNFGWNNHQLMAGLYFSKHKKEGAIYNVYIAPKYQVPLGTPISWGGIDIEGGWAFLNGMFFGININGGFDMKNNTMVGAGFSLGNVYDLVGALQFVYGGSVGLWYLKTYNYKYKGVYDPYDEYDYLAPFVKLRWKYIELMYRGLLGCTMGQYDLKKVDNGSGRPDFYWKEDVTNFGWNRHQLMLGYYFATSKRDRSR